MYSSSSSFNPFQYMTYNQITTITSSFTDNQNPSLIQEDNSSSPFLHFPPVPFHDDGDFLSELLIQPYHHQQQQQQQVLVSNTSTLAAEITHQNIINPAASNKVTRSNTNKNRSNINAAKQSVPRKRTGKKDRHSKIHTAQGPRDRRMRLSLQIARKFFDLQDMLGFDKASKTIDWLFTKSKPAIKELTDNLPRVKRSRSSGSCSGDGDGGLSVTSTSESEVMSGNNGERKKKVAEGDSFISIAKQKRSKRLSNRQLFNPVARESRDKARARARERTKEKQKIKALDKSKHCSLESNPSNLEKLRSASSLDNGENLGVGNQELKPHVKLVGEEEEEEEEAEEETGTYLLQHQMDSASIIDKFLGLTSAQKSSSIFDLSSGADFEDEFSGFPGNWDINDGKVQNRSYREMPNMKLSTGIVLQNPNAIFMTNPNAQEHKTSSNYKTISNTQEQNLTSVFMASLNTQEENPISSVFVNFSNSSNQNPSPVPMSTVDTALHSHFAEDQFSYNPNVVNQYGTLY